MQAKKCQTKNKPFEKYTKPMYFRHNDQYGDIFCEKFKLLSEKNRKMLHKFACDLPKILDIFYQNSFKTNTIKSFTYYCNGLYFEDKINFYDFFEILNDTYILINDSRSIVRLRDRRYESLKTLEQWAISELSIIQGIVFNKSNN